MARLRSASHPSIRRGTGHRGQGPRRYRRCGTHENEWIKACNHRDRYWLYVVYECAKSPLACLRRVQDPFGKLIVRAKGSVIVSEGQIFANAESE